MLIESPAEKFDLSVERMNYLAAAIQAMVPLNAFVRAPSCRNYDNLWLHIYRMKAAAITEANLLGATTARNIMVEVKCRRCGGGGTWTNGRRSENCFGCEGSGKTALFFRETTVGTTLKCQSWPGDPIVWHTPITWQSGMGAPTPVSDWKPNQPGTDLSPEQVLVLLNIAEPTLGYGENYGNDLLGSPANLTGGYKNYVRI